MVPYSMLTWQYAAFGPLAAMIWLFADLTPGAPNRPFSGLVASSAQLTGVGGLAGWWCLPLACDEGAKTAKLAATAATWDRRRLVIGCPSSKANSW